jgi:mRNA interferase MazF
MVIAQGDLWWAELPEPRGSEPGFARPVLVVQGDPFNRSRIATVLVVPLTSNLRLADLPGNVLIPAGKSGLTRDSVANISGLLALDRGDLSERIGRVSKAQLQLVFSGFDLVLDR